MSFVTAGIWLDRRLLAGSPRRPPCWSLQMRYHEQLNRVRGVLFYVAIAIVAIGFVIDRLLR